MASASGAYVRDSAPPACVLVIQLAIDRHLAHGLFSPRVATREVSLAGEAKFRFLLPEAAGGEDGEFVNADLRLEIQMSDDSFHNDKPTVDSRLEWFDVVCHGEDKKKRKSLNLKAFHAFAATQRNAVMKANSELTMGGVSTLASGCRFASCID